MTASLRTAAPRVPPLWWAVLAGGTITSVALGIRSTFGLFLVPVVDTLGTDRASFAFAIAIQQLTWGLSQPVAGAIADRYGTARVLAVGGVLWAVAMFMMSTAESSGMLLLSGGFLAGLAVAAASFTVILSAVGRMAPPEKRSLALGIVSAAGSVGQFVLIPVVERMLESGTWQDAAVVLGVIAISVIALAPVLRGRSIDQMSEAERATEVVPLRQDLHRAARSTSYLMLNAAFFVCGFHVTFIATHLPGYVDDLEISGAGTALALVGLFNIFGSLLAGYLGGRHSKTHLLAGIYGLRAVVIGVYVLLPVTTSSTLVFGAAMGVLWLSTVPLTSGIVTQQFGPANVGTLFGIVFLSHQLGAFGGAWLGGELADSTGSYDLAWFIAIALGVIAMLLHLTLDDGPIDLLPAAPRRGLAPAGGLASVILAVGLIGVLAPVRSAAEPSASSDIAARICLIGPGSS